SIAIEKELTSLKEKATRIAKNPKLIELLNAKSANINYAQLKDDFGILGLSIVDTSLNTTLSVEADGKLFWVKDSLANVFEFLIPQLVGLEIPKSNPKALWIKIACPVFISDKVSKIVVLSLEAPDLSTQFSGGDDNSKEKFSLLFESDQGVVLIKKNQLSHEFDVKTLQTNESQNFPATKALKGVSGYSLLDEGNLIFYQPVVPLRAALFSQHHERSFFSKWQTNYFLFSLLVVLILFLYFLNTFINLVLQRLFNSERYFYLLLVAIILSYGAFFSVYSFHKYQQYNSSLVDKAQNESKSIIDKMSSYSSGLIKYVNFLGSSLAEDIGQGKLARRLVNSRLTRLMKNYEDLHSIDVAFLDENLEWPSIKRAENLQLQSYDARNLPKNQLQAYKNFLSQCTKDQVRWNGPYVDSDQTEIISSCQPIHNRAQELIGYVITSLKMDEIRATIGQLSVSNFGYLIVFDSDNSILFHPYQRFVSEKKSLDELALKTDEGSLRFLARYDFKDKNVLIADKNFNDSLFLRLSYVSGLDWRLAYISFPDINLVDTTSFTWFGLNIYLCALILLLLLQFIGMIFVWKSRSLFIVRICTVLILACVQIILWSKLSKLEFYTNENEKGLIDTASTDLILTSYLGDKVSAKKIPFGIRVENYFTKDNKTVEITGIVWQVLENESDKPINFYFQEAIETDITPVGKFKIGKGVKWVYDFHTAVVVNEEATYYPFDLKKISLTVSPRNISSLVVFVPDFDAYPPRHEAPFLGLSKESSKNNLIFNTKFAFQKSFHEGESNELYSKIPALNFSINEKSSLTNAWVLYGLPLLIILVALFIVLLLFHREIQPLNHTIAAYLALLFALLLLHRNFSSVFNSKQLIYMEVFFISSYFMIVILFLLTSLRYLSNLSEKQKFLIGGKIVMNYWSILFSIWLIITLVWFFSGWVYLKQILQIIF
ncbi:MAG: hypothetical protein KC505_10690, partial [Myxococcales bacterium]|nr:hypothetical protein [Myxococcales bacterium]